MHPALLNGQWKGVYTYGNPYSWKGKSEPFTLDIICWEGIIQGTCADVYTRRYFDRPAVIEGVYDDNFISFIKKYPGLLTVDEAGRDLVLHDQPSLPIHYTGAPYRRLFSRRLRMKGEWSLTQAIRNAQGQMEFYTGSGTWRMTKINNR
ncbi:MAG TPA: hypothetical protein VHK69_22035 [Chitinophagaceae bacterium]|jgi:hypothetical protein|nr:hypothetical protein [Chitinophagaceae bacterium]